MYSDVYERNIFGFGLESYKRTNFSLHMRGKSVVIDGWIFISIRCHVFENLASSFDFHRRKAK